MAVEKAAGEPMADVERSVVSKTGREPTFPRDIGDVSPSETFSYSVEGYQELMHPTTVAFVEKTASFGLTRLLTRRHFFCARNHVPVT